MHYRSFDADTRWLIARLKRQTFAIPVCDVRELTGLTPPTRLPATPPYVRGAVNRRGEVIPILDLRVRLGMTPVADEIAAFCDLMGQREDDHRHWIAELEASVRERRAFTLTTDPHKCAFGRWYDTYQAENAWVALALRAFAEPHERIHRLGVEVEALKEVGRHDDALRLLDESRERGLNTMLRLFAELKAQIRGAHREVLAILCCGGNCAGATLDAAISVEKLTALEELPSGSADAGGLVIRAGRRADSDEVVLVLESDRLLSVPGP